MKISVVIPVGPGHALAVNRAIKSCIEQTHPAHEIIVAGFSDDVESQNVIKIKNEGSAGKNRQIGSEAASGDIIVYQDADDISHPQRLEIISRYFNIADILHLNHSLVTSSNETSHIEVNSIRHASSEELFGAYFPNSKYVSCIKHCPSAYGDKIVNWPVHCGAPAIRRCVLDKVKWRSVSELKLHHRAWPRTEDYEFCMEVLYAFNKSMIIDAPVYIYNELGTSQMIRD